MFPSGIYTNFKLTDINPAQSIGLHIFCLPTVNFIFVITSADKSQLHTLILQRQTAT